jgi:hypothetical protein
VRPLTKKQRVLDLVAARGWAAIGEAEWNELRSALPDVSETTIRQAGITISPPWNGVRQHSLEELAASLEEFSAVYESQPNLRQNCREQVIAAKDHARWASRYPERRALKTEMVEWMLVWLDDPTMFVTWMKIRRDRIGDCSNTSPTP